MGKTTTADRQGARSRPLSLVVGALLALATACATVGPVQALRTPHGVDLTADIDVAAIPCQVGARTDGEEAEVCLACPGAPPVCQTATLVRVP